jgi:hypothetical protein
LALVSNGNVVVTGQSASSERFRNPFTILCRKVCGGGWRAPLGATHNGSANGDDQAAAVAVGQRQRLGGRTISQRFVVGGRLVRLQFLHGQICGRRRRSALGKRYNGPLNSYGEATESGLEQ